MLRLFRKKRLPLKRLFKEVFYLIIHSRLFQITFLLSVLFLVGTWALPLWRLVPIGQEQVYIPLHYNIYFGTDRFGPWYQVFFLPGLGTVLLIVNTLFQAVFFKREKMLSRFFAIGTLFAEAILFLSMIFIVLLNI